MIRLKYAANSNVLESVDESQNIACFMTDQFAKYCNDIYSQQ